MNYPDYSADYARNLLKAVLKGYKTKIYNSTFSDDVSKIKKYGWISSGNFILVVGEKQ